MSALRKPVTPIVAPALVDAGDLEIVTGAASPVHPLQRRLAEHFEAGQNLAAPEPCWTAKASTIAMAGVCAWIAVGLATVGLVQAA